MGLLKKLFGGSDQKSTSQSGNNAYPWIQQNFGAGGASAFNAGTSGLQNLLFGNDPTALQHFWDSTGGNFLLNQGVNQVNSNMYARGLGQSGADMKGLENYRQDLASTKLNDLIQNYLGLAKLGLGAGSLVSEAGQYSKGNSSGSSSNGIGATLGALLAFI